MKRKIVASTVASVREHHLAVPQHASSRARRSASTRRSRVEPAFDQRSACRAAGRLMSQAQSVGVTVSETIADISIADGYRHRELAEQPPDDAAHQEHRNEHRHERERHRDDGEAHFARAVDARPAARHLPASIWRTMFSMTTIASSTTKPTAIVMPISETLSRL